LTGSRDASSTVTAARLTLERDGWAILTNGFSAAAMSAWAGRLLGDFSTAAGDLVREREGGVYAARNILDISPWIRTAWRVPVLTNFVADLLGPRAGLVRGLYFDKPPNQSWALPWHKDLLIAIQPMETVPPGGPGPAGYSPPRMRAGVWHTEPPTTVLEGMLTLRIHLDAATRDNGPLEVLTGSHVTGKRLETAGFRAETVLCDGGDVLAMRPLLVHSSGRSTEGTSLHRRIIHLEFAAEPTLPGGVRWHHFEPVG
jgi:hypothetical protein